MKVYVYFMGKPRDKHANGIAAEYLKRSSRYAKCEMRQVRPERFDPIARHAGAWVVGLDPAGNVLDSGGFTSLVRQMEEEARDLVFLIGGHDGLPEQWRKAAGGLLSLSAMTFPHELARAILAEQIYRAFTGLRGHPYPR
ncbi:MAG: 23S rRNA (pseudouridine(1915)-N(3))-methyltransferase RlmH [Acidimicrobiia bacterium]|nr:23S rRNA (pseudouridine(1915)-N(3))-methyltransferase RlmH [Acidimicrobiia bacterium]